MQAAIFLIIGDDLTTKYYYFSCFYPFAALAVKSVYFCSATMPGYRLFRHGGIGGKSGQHRAAHYLTGRSPPRRRTDSATENNRSGLPV